MAKYRYVAVDLKNRKYKDTIHAKDESDLRKTLSKSNLIPIKFKIIKDEKSYFHLKSKEIAEFSRQLHEMLKSKITVTKAIEIIKERDLKPELKEIYGKLHMDITKGYNLSEAMKRQQGVFPKLLINMYAAGETSGKIELVALKMAAHYKKEHRINEKIKSAMLYPAILFFVMLAVVMLIFTVILPSFFQFFQDIELPKITQYMVYISEYLKTNWYWFIIVVLLITAVMRYFVKTFPINVKYDKFILRLPVSGKLLKTIYTARFARTLSSLYSGGISILNSLEITSEIIDNTYIKSQFAKLLKNVENGEALSSAVKKIDGFDKKLSSTILIGEETGTLDVVLESIAESFDYESETAIQRLIQLINPIMIIIIAIIVGTIMFSVMLPLINLHYSMLQ